MLTDLVFRRAVDPPRPIPQLWGDPFADDGWDEVMQVVDWDSVDEDELFRFMPCLRRPTSGFRPAPIRSAFERCLDSTTRSASAANRRAISFDSGGPAERHEALALIRGLARRPIEDTPRYSEHDASRVAVLTGVHPAFVWPEALVSHDRFATFAWLGCLERARRALLPPEVAGYLVDTLRRDGSRIAVSDVALDRFIRSDVVSRALLRAATKRLTRATVVFDLDGLSIRAASTLRSWS